MKAHHNRYTKGMTLLEVMVALSVFAIAALAITKNLSEMMSNMPILEEKTLAQWVADNQMVDARLEQGFIPLGEKKGQAQLAGREWFWRREVIKTVDKDFRMIRISISDSDRFKKIMAQVSSYVANTQAK